MVDEQADAAHLKKKTEKTKITTITGRKWLSVKDLHCCACNSRTQATLRSTFQNLLCGKCG